LLQTGHAQMKGQRMACRSGIFTWAYLSRKRPAIVVEGAQLRLLVKDVALSINRGHIQKPTPFVIRALRDRQQSAGRIVLVKPKCIAPIQQRDEAKRPPVPMVDGGWG
jgi:hypothetical protein